MRVIVSLEMNYENIQKQEVLPVLSEERKSFDSKLSESEKKIIETARQKIEVRKIMFKNWYESEDFVPGKRAKDENFDDMRTDMRSSMEEVKKIAVAHSEELDAILTRIKDDYSNWKTDIAKIADDNGVDIGKIKKNRKLRLLKSHSPVSFLLFDPDKSVDNEILNLNNDVRVVIYPNPVVNKATITVKGAEDKNVEIVLYSKEGEKINTVFNALNVDSILESNYFPLVIWIMVFTS